MLTKIKWRYVRKLDGRLLGGYRYRTSTIEIPSSVNEQGWIDCTAHADSCQAWLDSDALPLGQLERPGTRQLISYREVIKERG